MKSRADTKFFKFFILCAFCFSLWSCSSGSSSSGGITADTDEEESPLAVETLATDLETFDSGEDLEAYLKEQTIAKMEETVNSNAEGYKQYGPGRIEDGSLDSNNDSFAAEAPDVESDYSTTNVQVEGVDEADFIKNDGDTIYILSSNHFIIYKARPGNETEELSRFEIEGNLNSLYIHNNMAVIFSNIYVYHNPTPCGPEADCIEPLFLRDAYYPGYYGFTKTKITFVDIQDKQTPELVRELYIKGNYSNSRRIGDIVRVVMTSSMPYMELHYYPANPSEDGAFDALKEQNRKIIEEAPLSEWIPDYEEVIHSSGGEETSSGELIRPENFYRPIDPSGYGILSIITIDLNDPTVHQNDICLIANVQHVYASKENLYVSTSPWYGNIIPVMTIGMPMVGISSTEIPKEMLKIHKFDIHSDPTKALYKATGEVEGHLLNQYSMDEHEGYLRVATTQGNTWNDSSSSNVFVLEEEEGKLSVTGDIREIAPTEQIYSARFMGDQGYLVTFKQIDPLFTLDLSDPIDPKIVGELKVPGFSSYIHPIGENHLLAIGKDTEDAGNFAWFQGIALSLFDVSDPANPTLIDKVIGSRGSDSEALRDPKAFNYFASKNLLAIPIVLYEGGTGGSDYGSYSSTGLHLYYVDPEQGFKFFGMVDHTKDGCIAGINTYASPCDSYWSSQLRRSVIIDDAIFSISNLLMRVSDLDDLTELTDPLIFLKDYLPIAAPVEIDYKQELTNSAHNISISLDAIKDSRCPKDVVCVWEGNASLTFTFSTNTESVEFDLNTHKDYQTRTKALGYEIELLDVKPYPVSGSPFDPEEYVATIMVSQPIGLEMKIGEQF